MLLVQTPWLHVQPQPALDASSLQESSGERPEQVLLPSWKLHHKAAGPGELEPSGPPKDTTDRAMLEGTALKQQHLACAKYYLLLQDS